MKTYLIALVLLLTATGFTPVSAQSNEASIRKTIDSIWPAFEKHDLEAFSGFFKQSPDLYYQISTADNQVIMAHGWDNMKTMIRGYFQSSPVSSQPATMKTTGSRIRITGNTATVTEEIDVNGALSLHFITLEKVADTWKITAFSGLSYAAGKLIVVN